MRRPSLIFPERKGGGAFRRNKAEVKLKSINDITDQANRIIAKLRIRKNTAPRSEDSISRIAQRYIYNITNDYTYKKRLRKLINKNRYNVYSDFNPVQMMNDKKFNRNIYMGLNKG